MAGEEQDMKKIKTSMTAAVRTVLGLAWIKSEEEEDVMDFWLKANTSSSSTTGEASRASAIVDMDDEDLAVMLAEDDWSYLFPTIVAKEEHLRVLWPGSSYQDPHGALHMVYKEMLPTSPMVANRKFTVLRTCQRVAPGTWVIAELSHVSPPNTYRRLPSGCLIQRVTDKLSKVTWVEHMEADDEPLPNRSAFAFAAERTVAWLQRSSERGSNMSATSTCHIKDPHGLEKLSLMDFGDTMARGLFQNVGPNQDSDSTLWTSVTGSEDLKVYASIYKSSANFEVAGAVVTFGVRHSPKLVVETLGDEQTHHEWDVLGGLTKLNTLRKYSTGYYTNSISASKIDGSSSKMLIREVNVNRSEALVLWSTVSIKDFDVMSLGRGSPKDTAVISGFSITTNGHTAATNTGGSVITLVLRKLVEGNQQLQEKWQQSIESITCAINQTVGRVKEALEKHQPPSPGGDWPTDKQVMQDELRVLKLD